MSPMFTLTLEALLVVLGWFGWTAWVNFRRQTDSYDVRIRFWHLVLVGLAIAANVVTTLNRQDPVLIGITGFIVIALFSSNPARRWGYCRPGEQGAVYCGTRLLTVKGPGIYFVPFRATLIRYFGKCGVRTSIWWSGAYPEAGLSIGVTVRVFARETLDAAGMRTLAGRDPDLFLLFGLQERLYAAFNRFEQPTLSPEALKIEFERMVKEALGEEVKTLFDRVEVSITTTVIPSRTETKVGDATVVVTQVVTTTI